MKIKLDYGKTGLDIRLPDSLNIDVVEPKYRDSLPNQAAAIEEVLLKPIDSKSLRDLIKQSDSVGIVFNDITRPTPYKIIFPVLLRELGSIPDERILLFNATGTHRANTEAELRDMLGDEVLRRYRIIQNDALDQSSHKSVGTTSSGNEIWLHKEYLGCDTRILTGFIEPHIFAGFSGGGKAAMPGLALLETVIRNHSVKNIDHPKATWGVTSGNPIYEEIRDAVSLAPPSFLLNVALNRKKEITAVFAGDFRTAHEQGCAYVKKNTMAAVEKPYDIVITSNSGYPLDLNLYQTIKGMSAAARIVRKGGSIVVVADCWDGIPDHGEYSKLLSEADSYESLLSTVRQDGFFRHDMWQIQLHGLICQKADVYFHSHNLSDEQIKGALLTPCSKVEETVDELLEKYGQDASICILPEGPQTIPYVSQS
ncbi:MAG: nickel-dependent lactate racemase [Planctomycetes bacterium]|nr:nickel-dependent lactate racemase [Planctomycetota bacterium]